MHFLLNATQNISPYGILRESVDPENACESRNTISTPTYIPHATHRSSSYGPPDVSQPSKGTANNKYPVFKLTLHTELSLSNGCHYFNMLPVYVVGELVQTHDYLSCCGKPTPVRQPTRHQLQLLYNNSPTTRHVRFTFYVR
jgi:hypothetical protein